MARIRRQAAVIPYRIRKARLEVALVTTSNGKGWIVPKGAIDEGECARDAAIREAEEEAGLRGIVARRPLGQYRHTNGHGPCLVDVYLMRVTRVMEEWMEDDLRRRRWMRVPDAAAHLQEELQGFIYGLYRSVRCAALAVTITPTVSSGSGVAATTLPKAQGRRTRGHQPARRRGTTRAAADAS